MLDTLYLILKIYLAFGVAFTITALWRDTRPPQTMEDLQEESEMWQEMADRSLWLMAGEMLLYYVMVVCIWPRYAFRYFNR